MTSERPIFVVGCPRSGTTLTQVMLHAHPHIAIPPENRFVLPLYQRRGDFGDLRERANRQGLARSIVGPSRKTRFADLGLDPDDIARQIVESPPTLGSAFAVIFRCYAAKFGKRRWGDKRPAYIGNIGVLLRLFPDAQIVNVVRDGRDVFASLQQRRWWKGGAYGAIRLWGDAIRAGNRARRRLGPSRYYELSYESLVAEPERTAQQLCAFLNEPFDAAMLLTDRQAALAVPERKLHTHHVHIASPISATSVGQFETQLEPWELELFELVNRRYLISKGYQLRTRQRPPPPRLAAYYAHVAQRRRIQTRRTVADWAQRLRDPTPLANQT